MNTPYQKGSAASKAAAQAAQQFAPSKRRQVYDFIAANPFVSDKEIQVALGMNPNTERPRRVELEHAGLIRPAGEDPNATGRVLYEITSLPYPANPPAGYWRSKMRTVRAERPTRQEIAVAVATLRSTQQQHGQQWPREVTRVIEWLEKQA